MTSALIVGLLLALQPMVTSDSDCPSTHDIEDNLSVLLPANEARPGNAVVMSRSDGIAIQLQPEGAEPSDERSIAVGSRCEDRAQAAAVEMKPLELNSLVDDAMLLLASSSSEGTRLLINLCDGELSIRGDSSQMSQVIHNLVLNAIQAVDKRGRVNITTRKTGGKGQAAGGKKTAGRNQG